jgi:hypothetical protein
MSTLRLVCADEASDQGSCPLWARHAVRQGATADSRPYDYRRPWPEIARPREAEPLPADPSSNALSLGAMASGAERLGCARGATPSTTRCRTKDYAVFMHQNIRFAWLAGLYIVVAVQDAGSGLDVQSMARLFDAFFTAKPGGMGMGLSISRRIIEAHGGRLWATPNDGLGATVQFTLPMGGEQVS